MKIAVITTTIRIPQVLQLYREYDQEVVFFIAGDLKTPHEEVQKLCRELSDCYYFGPAQQSVWQVSEALGWNCIQRRNIALLEALKWGADLIITIDDDNFPLASDYFADFRYIMSGQHSGMLYQSDWFDVGQYLVPPIPQRGFPTTEISGHWFGLSFDMDVGVAQGAVLGDPDCSAVDRISQNPLCHNASAALMAGIFVDPYQSWSIFNSQNTAFRRCIAPCMFVWPNVGRYDDIYASLVAQRVLREQDMVVHFGEPAVWQARRPQDSLKNLADELKGMSSVVEITQVLDDTELQGGSTDMLAKCVQALGNYIPKGRAVFDLWRADVESALS